MVKQIMILLAFIFDETIFVVRPNMVFRPNMVVRPPPPAARAAAPARALQHTLQHVRASAHAAPRQCRAATAAATWLGASAC